jgi:octaprenyl-diphosphate synthase
VSEEVCFGIIENKTASLIESCGAVGAILAGADDPVKRSVGRYGFNIGVAFQLVDDALDYSSSEKEFGKGVGQDLIEGKMTLPLFYSLSLASGPEKKRTREILLKRDGFADGELVFVRELVEKYSGVEKTKSVAKDFILRARGAISSLPESSCKDSLLMLAEYVAERRN